MRTLLCIGLLWLAVAVQAQTITHGPIIGGVTTNGARSIMFANGAGVLELQVSTSNNFATYRSFFGTTDSVNGYSSLFTIDSLQPDTKYYYRGAVNGQARTDVRSFSTYPCTGSTPSFVFGMGSCMNEDLNTDNVFIEAANHNMRFFLQVGDWGYPDDTDDYPNDSDYFPAEYSRVVDSYKDRYSYIHMRNFLKNVPVDYVWDDHDYVNDNTSGYTASHTDYLPPVSVAEDSFPPGTRRNALAGYYSMFPGYEPVDSTKGVFHKFRYGNVEVFMLDDRSSRSPNTDALQYVNNRWVFNPPAGHSILGDVQRQWFLDNLRQSTATWKFVITATAFNKTYGDALNNVLNLPNFAGMSLAAALIDCWAGFPMDRDSIMNCVQDNQIDGIVMMSGDTHTAAIDDGSNGGLPEIMAGALSQANSTLYTTVPLLTQGLRWTSGQGINGNTNYNDAFGKITVRGDTSVTIQLVDENGTSIASHTIFSCSYLTGLALSADSLTQVLCHGDSTGEIHLSASGGTPPYTYSLDGKNWSSSPVLTGVPAGAFHPAVKDASGCTKEVCVSLTEPEPLTAVATITDAKCYGDNNGFISVSMNGGVAPRTLQWADGPIAASRPNLAAGQYTVTITDRNGCELVLTPEVQQPDSLYLSTTVTPATCYGGNNASIVATIEGGNAPVTLQWGNGSSALTRNNLTAGFYTFTLTDSKGCVNTDTTFVGQPAEFLPGQTMTPDNGTDNGTLTLNPTGGNAPYTYEWFNGSNSSSQTGLTAGLYPVTIIDAVGCRLDTSLQVAFGVGIDAAAMPELQVYPNPLDHVLHVKMELGVSANIEVEVYDMSGKRWYQKTHESTSQLNLTLEATTWPKGVMWLSVKAGQVRMFRKLVVQ